MVVEWRDATTSISSSGSVVTAVFTTSHARLKLLGLMETVVAADVDAAKEGKSAKLAYVDTGSGGVAGEALC